MHAEIARHCLSQIRVHESEGCVMCLENHGELFCARSNYAHRNHFWNWDCCWFPIGLSRQREEWTPCLQVLPYNLMLEGRTSRHWRSSLVTRFGLILTSRIASELFCWSILLVYNLPTSYMNYGMEKLESDSSYPIQIPFHSDYSWRIHQSRPRPLNLNARLLPQ